MSEYNPRTTNSPSQDSFHPDDQIPSKHYIIQYVSVYVSVHIAVLLKGA